MNTDRHADDRLTTALGELPAYDVAPARAARIAERCHAELRRGACRRADAGLGWGRAARWQRVLEPALVAGVSVAFLVEVIGRALALEGF
jgi:hypothetical protein